MFIVMITYKKPLAEVEQHLVAHRNFLEAGYQRNCFVASGPQNPRTGGVIISQLQDKTELERLLQDDPFLIHDIADYQFIEFNPVKYHPNFAPFIS